MHFAPSGAAAPALFTFEGHKVRTVQIDGNPWFVAVDVYALLFGRTTGISSVAKLDDDERRSFAKGSANSALRSLFQGSVSRVALVSESGLYKLILRANDSPSAARFQDWVTREVLPAIRKDGAYIKGTRPRREGEEKVRTGEMSEDELILKAVTIR